MTCGSFVGKRVRLLREVVLGGGGRHAAGTCWVVAGTWRGKFHLRRWGSGRGAIRLVDRSAFELYPMRAR